ncbi:MAG: ATP-binding domain-containing protein, partial [Mameliella sp.]|nr:ATP-binding domain-containing protein [Phaeodactylibacter sp.]
KPRFKIEGGETIERELVFRDVLVEVTDVNGKPHQLRTTLLDRFLTAEEGRLHPYDQRALYIDFKERMRKSGIERRSDAFAQALKSDKYFNALQAKYGYAITCHKSQGGEWENVIVDFKVYIGTLSPGFFRWAYTAITRASECLYCIDAPDYNALSKFVVTDIERISAVMKGAYFVPTSEGQGDYFVVYRKERILELCEARDMAVQFKTHANQLDTTFKQADETVRVQLWFGKAGFSRTSWVSSTSEVFKNQVNDLLHKSLMSKEVPFEHKFPFQKELHEYLLGLLKEEDILLTNVVQKDWSDQYFLYTGAECALLEFFYNGKHQYTKAMPKSMLGANDEKLNRLIKRLRDG